MPTEVTHDAWRQALDDSRDRILERDDTIITYANRRSHARGLGR